ncbi:sugar ABC transporter substrate-binding protein [Actinoplanes sp. LDG1-06]|uniref:Sugar ABC transporter substrate-binding protein n=1 Tax=Paractinoplanes ovalisporus TaxID=2810368 RepID=A0ABS2AP63_9ACTN|nr:sugar ABC transporter substrate-binding protein [Actinoplanes ovalisporus]MBM2621647.1 sugar ABC transporter substrate-binding protein [Actinoplanes ovalisporus]
MKRKRLIIPAVFVLGLSACSGDTRPATGSAAAASAGTKAIAFSPLALKIPAMKGLSEGVQGYGRSQGYEVIVQDPNLDPQKQLTELQSVIETGRVGGAWVIAVQPSSLSALVKTAQEKKIPLILNGVPTDYGLAGLEPLVSFSTIDYEAQGKAIGEELGQCVNEKLGGKAEVFHLINQPGTAGKEQLESSALAALKATAPGATIVQDVVTTDRQAVQTGVSSALQGHPGVTAVLGANDEAALGSLGAFDAAGKKLTCLTEAGGNDEVLGLVKEGRIYASVVLQFDADMKQSFDALVTMMGDPSATGVQMTVPQEVMKAGG